MNTNPLITIGIPVYNVAAYIEQCLLSALDQTYDNLEILIIDDKGTDHSIDIVQNMMSTHPRGASIRIISNSSNKGVGESRDIALMNAKGEYFYFLDSDDYIAENTIQILYEALVKADVDMSVGSYVNVYSTHSQVTQYDKVLFSGQDAFQRYFFFPPPISRCCME
jgi:glycosyltransferase involved in cell wall biosynthesis